MLNHYDFFDAICDEIQYLPKRTLPWEEKEIDEIFYTSSIKHVYRVKFDAETRHRHLVAKFQPRFGVVVYVEVFGTVVKSNPSENEYHVLSEGYVFATRDHDLFFRLIDSKLLLPLTSLSTNAISEEAARRYLPKPLLRDALALTNKEILSESTTVQKESVAKKIYDAKTYPKRTVFVVIPTNDGYNDRVDVRCQCH